MCGIFVHLGSEKDLIDNFNRISYRGPDQTECTFLNNKLFFGFHRLAIIGLDEISNQPMYLNDKLALVCNGEIYNYIELIKKYDFDVYTNSDCEVILHMYNRFGIERTVKELDGVFAFCLYDLASDELFAARDPFGVRPAFIGENERKEIYIASEIKSIFDLCSSIKPFPPGTWWSSNDQENFIRYYSYDYKAKNIKSEENICKNINNLLTNAVIKRLMSNREVGCLLSGGLDSSLVSALVAKHSDQFYLNTFSIGMQGSPDLEYAEIVANHIGTKHHSVVLSEKDFLNSIEEVIYKIESYDTTTVRASVGNYLISKYIKDNTDVKVVFNGDGSDEVCMGYVYNKNAPSSYDFFNENIRLLKEIHLFDVLRSDRSISSNGLEARTPFLDKAFVDYYMTIPAKLKMFSDARPEKYLLRKAFDNSKLLPSEVLWRHKCAFSDGISSVKASWHKILKQFIDSIITDNEFNSAINRMDHCCPVLKESYYYRKVFENIFGKRHVSLIPHFWMPKWSNVTDPSAREL